MLAIATVAIKNLKMHLDNLNLLLRKNTIWFKPLAQKGGLVSQRLVHYINNTKSLSHRGVYLSGENMSQNPPFTSKLNCYYLL